MPVTDSAAEKRLEPLVLVDTADLTEEEWLSYSWQTLLQLLWDILR